MNDSFVSAVEDKTNPDMLYVRARKREHLVVLMKNVGKFFDIQYTKHRDYQFRIYVPKIVFATEMLPAIVMGIDYSNFKNSVKDMSLKMFYSSVWTKGVEHLDNRSSDEFWADQMGLTQPEYENYYYGKQKRT